MLFLFPAQKPDQEAADDFQADRLRDHDHQGHDGEKPAVVIEKLLEPAAEIMKHEREVGDEEDRVEQQLEEKGFPVGNGSINSSGKARRGRFNVASIMPPQDIPFMDRFNRLGSARYLSCPALHSHGHAPRSLPRWTRAISRR